MEENDAHEMTPSATAAIYVLDTSQLHNVLSFLLFKSWQFHPFLWWHTPKRAQNLGTLTGTLVTRASTANVWLVARPLVSSPQREVSQVLACVVISHVWMHPSGTWCLWNHHQSRCSCASSLRLSKPRAYCPVFERATPQPTHIISWLVFTTDSSIYWLLFLWNRSL